MARTPNLGALAARGLWGKMNLYEESAAIPLIVAPAPAPAAQVTLPSTCETAVSLLDLSETIIEHFAAELPGERPGKSLVTLADQPLDPQRQVLSQYHAIGAVSGAFMLRKGPWKLIEYAGFGPELFNLHNDPDEAFNLAQDPALQETLVQLMAAMREICDPDVVNAAAFADQDALIASFGGKAVAATMGAPAATPPPES